MVVIRLARVGCKHNPKYRVAVADQRRAATGSISKLLEILILALEDRKKV